MQGKSSRHGSQHTPNSQVSSYSNPNLVTLRSRIGGKKNTSLREIYDDDDDDDLYLNSNFALLEY